jgi:hypothetical protein
MTILFFLPGTYFSRNDYIRRQYRSYNNNYCRQGEKRKESIFYFLDKKCERKEREKDE